MELLIVTGMSGAGKSTVIQILEDMNYFCVDNLPPALFYKFFELIEKTEEPDRKIALVIDIRSGKHLKDIFIYLDGLKERNINSYILFLEASDKTIVDRFKETRRKHPMIEACGGVLEGIKEERRILEDIRGRADLIIDTSSLSAANLRERVKDLWGKNKGIKFRVSFMSFGYKYGVPIDADLLVDVRFLPNPFYIPELKEKTGNDKEVQDFVFNQEATTVFLEKYIDLLSFLLPMYEKEGKSNLTVGIGCTGGKHRSVTLANYLTERISEMGYQAEKRHRDIDRK
ncbi:MAG: RNase adapter RapZ [Clostridia bacterium]|nr:RNase adapter RapZ [Clostridia bacterium]